MKSVQMRAGSLIVLASTVQSKSPTGFLLPSFNITVAVTNACQKKISAIAGMIENIESMVP